MTIKTEDTVKWMRESSSRGLAADNGLNFKKAEECTDLLWPASIQSGGNNAEDSAFCLVRLGTERALLVIGPAGRQFSGVKRSHAGVDYLFCPLTHENAAVLRKILPFTAPSRVLEKEATFGTGDRLGTAAPGYLRALRGTTFVPVLAQQSVRELELTGRDYAGLIDSATWAVFQEGYKGPWGADGDHLKTTEWVGTALRAGCTMITADLSDHIQSEYEESDRQKIDQAYGNLPNNYRGEKETKYLKMTVPLDGGDKITFNRETLKRVILVYKEAVEFAARLYSAGRKIRESFDFEISIDETEYPTLPEAHVFVVEELREAGVDFQTIAPRFIGEFQKGIDYIGNVGEFKKTFAVHTAIARYYGHKLSVHSGSDKFSVFPIIGRETGGRFHLKTSGTHWLQALSLILETNPKLFRWIYGYALEVFPVTRTYYHITPDLTNMPDAEALEDGDLGKLLKNTNSRQVLHVSYGEIHKNENIKTRLFGELAKNEGKYYKSLAGHLKKHVSALGTE